MGCPALPPNLLIAAADDVEGTPEAGWSGRPLWLGALVVWGELPTARCGMPVHAQANPPQDPAILRTVVRAAGQCLGLYASVVQPGGVSVEDVVDIP